MFQSFYSGNNTKYFLATALQMTLWDFITFFRQNSKLIEKALGGLFDTENN